jgi:hypothetical protein
MEKPYKKSEEESCSSKEFVGIKMPLTPASPTGSNKRVNFLVTSRSVDAPIDNNSNLGFTTTKGKSSSNSRSSILPKLNFRYNRTTSTSSSTTVSDIEKGIIANPESSFIGPQEKPSISGSVSLSKIFNPKINRTSSLPVEEIGRVNTEFAFGGCLGASPYVRV